MRDLSTGSLSLRSLHGRGLPLALGLLALLGAAGCMLDVGNAPKASQHLGAFEPGAEMVAGDGDRLAVWSVNPSGARLVVLHQDPVAPGLPLQDAALMAGDCNGRDLTVNAQWISAAGECWVSYAPVVLTGFVRLARSADPAAGAWRLDLAGWSRADHAAAWEDRLVVASGAAVRLYDVSDPAAPRLLAELVGASPVTAVLASGAGIFAFTEGGYVSVDTSAGTFTEVTDAALAGIRHASAEGGKLHVGGTSRKAGCFRVARLAAAAGALAIEADADELPDTGAADGEVIEMAFDAARGEYLVVRATNPRPLDLRVGTTRVLRLRDGPSIGAPEQAELDLPAVTSYSMASTTPLIRAHASAGVLYAILVPGVVGAPVDAYRLP